jgi:hypothetical protein
MQKWEYKLLSSHWSEAELKKLGEDGWELAGITVGGDATGISSGLIFKRPKQ